MIDLTPLDVRKKKGDFGKTMRGYDPREVDHFLELVAERMDELVMENRTLKERAEGLDVRVRDREGREHAVQEALVTAQALRMDMREQAKREADLIRREAEASAQGVRDSIERIIEDRKSDLRSLIHARSRFLISLRTLVEREMAVIEAEEANPPPLDVDLAAIARRAESAVRRQETLALDSLLRDEHAEASEETGVEPAGSGEAEEGSGVPDFDEAQDGL